MLADGIVPSSGVHRNPRESTPQGLSSRSAFRLLTSQIFLSQVVIAITFRYAPGHRAAIVRSHTMKHDQRNGECNAEYRKTIISRVRHSVRGD